MELKMWGGFVDGKLFKQCVHRFPQPGAQYEQWSPSIFYTRKAAREQFEDVRRVTVTVGKKWVRRATTHHPAETVPVAPEAK